MKDEGRIAVRDKDGGRSRGLNDTCHVCIPWIIEA
jgi:hypothetical protein